MPIVGKEFLRSMVYRPLFLIEARQRDTGTNPAVHLVVDAVDAERLLKWQEGVVFRDFALAGVVVFTLTVIGFFQPQFFDPVSLLITCGGALMVTCFSYSRSQLRNFLVALRDLLATKATTVQ